MLCRKATFMMLALFANVPGMSVSAQTASVVRNNYVPPNRMVILDYSGSMSERYYENAREAALQLTTSVGDVDPRAKTGLVVFGHTLGSWDGVGYTRDEHCADIEIEYDYGELNSFREKELLAAGEDLQKLKPGGETPIVKSVELAAEQLDGDGGSVILVTDLDEEMCSRPKNNDPCFVMEDLIATYARSSIFITHVIAVRTNKNAGAKRLAQCSGATLLQLGSDPGDIDKVVTQVNDDLKGKLLPVIVDIKVDYSSVPILTPKSTSSANISIIDENGSEKRYHYSSIISKPVRPGRASVVVEMGELRKKVLIDVSSKKHNEVRVAIATAEVQLQLVGPNGVPIPTDIPVDWNFTGAGDERPVAGSPEITINALPFTHQVEARYPGYVGKTSFAIVSGHRRLLRTIKMEPLKVSEGGGKFGMVTADFDYSNPPLYSPPMQELSLLLTPTTGPQSVISLVGGQPNEVSEGDYKFFLDTLSDKFLLGKLKIRAETRVVVTGSLPSAVLEVNTEPSVGDDAVWTLSDGNSEIQFQGRVFRQEIYPGDYRIRVTDQERVVEVDISLPSSGGNVLRTIKM